MEDRILDYFLNDIYELDLADNNRETLEQEVYEKIKEYVSDMTEDIKNIINDWKYEFSKEHILDEQADREYEIERG